jgi:hypothetical protein
MDDGPFRYHLELTPDQLKITHTALHALLDGFGHDEPEIVEITRAILDKLPDDHAIRAIRLGHEHEQSNVVEINPGDDEGPAA